MTCPNCSSIESKKFGKDRKGLSRHQCRNCKRTFTEPHGKPLGGMYTEVVRAEEILKLLIEGCSVGTILPAPPAPYYAQLFLLHAPTSSPDSLLEKMVSSDAYAPLGRVALWYTNYNFGRIHKSLGMTPAMAAGITSKVRDLANSWRPRE